MYPQICLLIGLLFIFQLFLRNMQFKFFFQFFSHRIPKLCNKNYHLKNVKNKAFAFYNSLCFALKMKAEMKKFWNNRYSIGLNKFKISIFLFTNKSTIFINWPPIKSQIGVKFTNVNHEAAKDGPILLNFEDLNSGREST